MIPDREIFLRTEKRCGMLHTVTHGVLYNLSFIIQGKLFDKSLFFIVFDDFFGLRGVFWKVEGRGNRRENG